MFFNEKNSDSYNCLATPLWRNGPSEKPVLCNACGSHFNTRGTLENYLPKIVQQAQLLEANTQEKCENNAQLNIDEAAGEKGFELSNSSSSGVINTNLRNTEIPQSKHSYVKRKKKKKKKKLTPIEKFQKELLNLYESQKHSKESSRDNILLDDNMNNFIPNNEIGLGCSLLKTNVTSADQNHSHGSMD
ncbi:unnamed protein product [Trifolium pratense]|uniref:Uncharacterized protein n=1 Tax=Trifolium pratense TaxID=57577 RepID=A0ACB0JM00_TRIPR|nr:unnamed protein product [Trifolium pratense]